MLDPLADTTARLEQLVEQAMKETDPDKSDELCAEIWRVLRERDEVRKTLPVAGQDGRRNHRPQHSLNFSAWNFRSANWTALETMDESFP